MNLKCISQALGAGWLVHALALSLPTSAGAQVVITSDDFFNEVGLYYRAYANTADVPVAAIIGSAGGPQSWDFTTGPTDQIYRFDYVSVDDEGHGADFPEAAFAERKTEETSGAKAWLYLKHVPGLGRQNYGFYDPAFSASHPSHPFSVPITDFPDTIRYQDSWTTSTSFETIIDVEIPDIGDGDDLGGGLGDIFGLEEEEEEPGGFEGFPAIIHYTSTAKVDAYGIVNQPGIGFDDCLRVNELVEYNIEVDLGLGDGFQTVATQFIRNYYWLRKGAGIAVQITSKQLDTPPADNFPLAASFVRMFESNHPGPSDNNPGNGITNLKITLGNGRVLLNWTKASGASNYRVEYTDNPLKPDSWTELETTTSNFAVDPNISEASHRFYRIVGLP